MRSPSDFNFNLNFDKEQEEYYVVFEPKDGSNEEDVWTELMVVMPSGFWRLDESTYEFLMKPHEAIETLKRVGFTQDLGLV